GARGRRLPLVPPRPRLRLGPAPPEDHERVAARRERARPGRRPRGDALPRGRGPRQARARPGGVRRVPVLLEPPRARRARGHAPAARLVPRLAAALDGRRLPAPVAVPAGRRGHDAPPPHLLRPRREGVRLERVPLPALARAALRAGEPELARARLARPL